MTKEIRMTNVQSRSPRGDSSSSMSPSPPSDGGEGRGARSGWFPLLSPLVPRGERRERLMQPWASPTRQLLGLCWGFVFLLSGDWAGMAEETGRKDPVVVDE